MKFILSGFIIAAATTSYAETKPLAEWSVSSIVSSEVELKPKVHSGIRYRAITSFSVEGESPSELVIEKVVEPTAPGNPSTLAWSKKVSIPELDKVNKISEAGYMGNFPNMKWDGKSLTFDFYDFHKKKNLSCVIKNVEDKALSATCK